MKVKEILKLLADADPEMEVVMAKDAEGNSYSPLAGMWCGVYRPTTTWYGEVGFAEMNEELRLAGYSDEDVLPGGVPSVILTPTN